MPITETKQDGAAPPLVVVGMHRSGTSLAASFLSELGVDVGRRLLAGDRNNRRGYFEDEDFLELQRRALAACCPEGSEGWPDWGFTRDGKLEREMLAAFRGAATDLLRLPERVGPWGWKDPRTTLLLDFWDVLLPEARYLGVYRAPWEVADSIGRVGGEAFRLHPEWALEAWSLYNRHLLDFARRNPDRVLLVECRAIPDDPAGVVLAIRERLGVSLPAGDGAGQDPAAAARVAAARLWDPEGLARIEPATPPPEPVRALFEELGRAAAVNTREAPAPVRYTRGLTPRDPGPSPAATVVIPCHDDGRFLGDAVASALLLPQPVPEILIVDDGSRDPDTLETLRLLSEAGFSVLRQENRGLGAARNAGIRAARGRFLLPLDADNLLEPACLRAGLAILETEPRVGVVYGDAIDFGTRLGRRVVGPFDPVRIASGNYVDACALFRREVWEEAGGYDEEMAALGHQDWDLWLSAVEKGWEMRYVAEPLFDYRVRAGSMTAGLYAPDVRHALWRHVVRKHRAFYAKHLAELLARQELALFDAEARVVKARAAASAPVPLPPEGFRVEWLEIRVAERAAPGAALAVRVRLRNTSPVTWPDVASTAAAGAGAVRLGYRWWDAARERVLSSDAGRVDLPGPLPPDEEVTLEFVTVAPMRGGTCLLQVDLVQELVAWFETRGAPRLEARVRIG